MLHGVRGPHGERAAVIVVMGCKREHGHVWERELVTETYRRQKPATRGSAVNVLV